MLFSKKKETDNEFARVIDWKPVWSGGAPMPHVFCNGMKTYLIYLIAVRDPNWDGTYTTVIDADSDTTYPLALVEFSGTSFKFGMANDEVFSGLKLWNKGLESYAAHVIENSNWIKELKKIHQVHPYYNEEHWKKKKHYIFLFHDEIFEIVAKDYKVETFEMSFKELAIIVINKMYD